MFLQWLGSSSPVEVEGALLYSLGCCFPLEVADIILIGRVHGPGRQFDATIRHHKGFFLSHFSFAVRRAKHGVVDVTKMFYCLVNLLWDSWGGGGWISR